MSGRPSAPLTLQDLSPTNAPEPELAALARLHAAGLTVAPFCIVPAQIEEHFYRLNNLPDQLNALFKDVDPRNPDEDDVELLAPEAEALIMRHYLLDAFIDLFYESLAALPSTLRLRRAEAGPGYTAGKGRPALLALKRLWADDWRFEVVMARLDRDQGIALQARSVVVAPAGLEPADVTLNDRAAELLGTPVRIRHDREAGITQVVFER